MIVFLFVLFLCLVSIFITHSWFLCFSTIPNETPYSLPKSPFRTFRCNRNRWNAYSTKFIFWRSFLIDFCPTPQWTGCSPYPVDNYHTGDSLCSFVLLDLPFPVSHVFYFLGNSKCSRYYISCQLYPPMNGYLAN